MSNISFTFYQEFQNYIKNDKKNFSRSNYKKAPGKENFNNFIDPPEQDLNILEAKSSVNKRKNLYTPRKFNVKQKIYYKNGKGFKFNLFKEREIGLNGWDKKINILESEEDYDSDDNIILDGKGKTKDDIIEAMRLFKNNKFKEIQNYSKYCKYNKIKQIRVYILKK